MKLTRELLRENLSNKIVLVLFTKKNGDPREMYCTTLPEEIPEELQPKGVRENNDPDLFKVFDVDLNAWRSFRFESLLEVDGILTDINDPETAQRFVLD